MTAVRKIAHTYGLEVVSKFADAGRNDPLLATASSEQPGPPRKGEGVMKLFVG
jgi:hypothetical protein